MDEYTYKLNDNEDSIKKINEVLTSFKEMNKLVLALIYTFSTRTITIFYK